MYQPGDGQRAPYFGNYPRHYIVNGDGSGKSTAITSLGGSPSVGLGGRKQQNETVEGGLIFFIRTSCPTQSSHPTSYSSRKLLVSSLSRCSFYSFSCLDLNSDFNF